MAAQNEKTFKVPNIGCNGCVQAIQSELSDLPGVQSVRGDVDSKTVHIEWNPPTDWANIKAALIDIEYPPEEG